MRTDRRQVERKARIASLSFFVALFAFWGWWYVASNYDYSALAGTYAFRGDGVTSKLVLKSDQTFHQQVTIDGRTSTADGTWHRSGEAGVNFSIEFLRVPGAKTFVEEFGKRYGSIEDNEFFGYFEKFLGIYPPLHLYRVGELQGPVFHKQLFR
ncbi:MAG TPA: hypothetical protein VFA99_14435 [Acidobacteriaceae bacterium]|nr:hypothetical protein [Acidobacteriaceae bacterium]